MTTTFKLSVWKTACIVCVILTAISSSAQTFTSLADFDGANGDFAYLMTLVQGTDGNLYGTTILGGANASGEVFKITPSGLLTTMYSFCAQPNCTDGNGPAAGLVLSTDGNLYGTTRTGGPDDAGTVFKITPSGTLTTLYSFCALSGCTDGAGPCAGLIQATDGNFYGTTGGAGAGGYGTVFKITPSGTLTTLHSFSGHDGVFPIARLVQGSDGNFYGTTSGNGEGSNAHKFGSIFKITPLGQFITLHAFAGVPTDGQTPFSALVQATDGNFYGTTPGGGINDTGIIFKITPSGTTTTIFNFDFDGIVDGAFPVAGLVLANDGNFYGTTTEGGGPNNAGTIFEFTLAGTLTTLHTFDVLDTEYRYHGLAQATNGTFYGTTNADGASGEGTVFSLSVGLDPFVATLPTSGKVGQTIRILGSNLTGATSVTFNGIAATFTVLSHSLIQATVPSSATTGPVQVVTPSGTLTSNMVFRVR